MGKFKLFVSVTLPILVAVLVMMPLSPAAQEKGGEDLEGREAEVAVTQFLRQLGRRGLIALR